MYKVFVNDIPIILSTQKDFGENYTTFPLKSVKLKRLIKRINKGTIMYVNLYHPDENKLLKLLFKKIKVVTAAGGLVYNEAGEILFIYRNKRWDLPKGKTEKDETIESSAVREVEEETGVEGLEVTHFLRKTYHIFKRKGKFRLKVTHWYEMKTSYEGELRPEITEGIEKAVWKNPEKTRKALTKSYANIKMLFPEKLLARKSEDWVA
ncbi:NUDIX hydrolase [Salegentibacter chungangensis]|uniref:NUDIX hydrolase n=1 Tax=Salegentibacter chungangensis TaxID=1335724 RepID=A0ABW3NUL6_9FLAO